MNNNYEVHVRQRVTYFDYAKHELSILEKSARTNAPGKNVIATFRGTRSPASLRDKCLKIARKTKNAALATQYSRLAYRIFSAGQYAKTKTKRELAPAGVFIFDVTKAA